MIVARAARQVPLSALLIRRHPTLSTTLITRSYAAQATASAPNPSTTSQSPSQPSTVTPGPTTKDDASTSFSDSHASVSITQPDPELSALIRRMMSNRRPKTRLDSADEVAAELDRMSGNVMAQRQGELLDNRMSGSQSLDYDVLGIGRRASRLPPLNPPVRCDAYIGRAETVGRGVTLARAIEKLNIKLALNRVRSDINRQRFHERPGLRRKRLKRERWRRRFKKGFVATIQKVQKMTKKGW